MFFSLAVEPSFWPPESYLLSFSLSPSVGDREILMAGVGTRRAVRQPRGTADSVGKTPPAASEDVDLRGGRIKMGSLVERLLESSNDKKRGES